MNTRAVIQMDPRDAIIRGLSEELRELRELRDSLVFGICIKSGEVDYMSGNSKFHINGPFVTEVAIDDTPPLFLGEKVKNLFKELEKIITVPENKHIATVTIRDKNGMEILRVNSYGHEYFGNIPMSLASNSHPSVLHTIKTINSKRVFINYEGSSSEEDTGGGLFGDDEGW